METVTKGAGVSITGEVYTDTVGKEGSGTETFIKMIMHNVNVYVEGLKKSCPICVRAPRAHTIDRSVCLYKIYL
jgi:hypothetical protein